jgi:hypothetical protein
VISAQQSHYNRRGGMYSDIEINNKIAKNISSEIIIVAKHHKQASPDLEMYALVHSLV